MNDDTFRSRLGRLLQKSRKALRLYTTMGRLQEGDDASFSDCQIAEWREVNADLVRELTRILSVPAGRQLVSDIYALRDRFYTHWRLAESDLHEKQKNLLTAAENSDFVRSAVLSRELVVLKARVQASQAAHHELQSVLDRSQASVPSGSPETEEVLEDEDDSPLLQQAKVIPLRRKGS